MQKQNEVISALQPKSIHIYVHNVSRIVLCIIMYSGLQSIKFTACMHVLANYETSVLIIMIIYKHCFMITMCTE